MRKATLSDIPRILEIELTTQLAPWTEEIFHRCIKMGCDFWVVEENNCLIAYIIVSSSITQESHILNLCVDPAFQRKGYGQKLITHALSHAKRNGMGTIYLEVRRSNIGAIALYQKNGFIQIGERKNYYPNSNGQEDALVFAMDLATF